MLGEAGSTLKEGIVGSLKGLNEIGTQIISLAHNTLTDVLKPTGSVANETSMSARTSSEGQLKPPKKLLVCC